MAIYALSEELFFPPVQEAESDGLLAIGGDLSPERLLLAYRLGIFPWYEGVYPLWWSPDPRFILYPAKLKISRSMKALLKKNDFQFTTNTAFDKVVTECQQIKRKGQDGTWITEEVRKAYGKLHELGYAHSAETWRDDE